MSTTEESKGEDSQVTSIGEQGGEQEQPCKDPSTENQETEKGKVAKADYAVNMYSIEPSDDGTFCLGEEVNVDAAIVRKLSDAFLQHFLPSLEMSKSSVAEILSNQTVLIDTLEQENAKFNECAAHVQLSAMMLKAKNYHNKLLNIKRDMANLHDKAAKLKRRALKLQQQKQKDELQRAHQQERELEREHMLTARVARPNSKS